MSNRTSGLVAHISSLPGPYGIGSIGAPARRFVDFLVKCGQTCWQMLPLNPTGYANSPYQSCSTFAGNPYFIDLDELCAGGLVLREELMGYHFGSDPDLVDYGLLYQNRPAVLRLAFARGRERCASEIEAFSQQHKTWLRDYALYMAVKESFGMKALKDWPDKALVAREKKAVEKALSEHREAVAFHEFTQFLFWTQWESLRAYAKARGILMVGDLPIYVSEDSVEVWTHPELFDLKEPAQAASVAGVPPDLYSETGQLWGNPLYNWEYHAKTGYRWWLSRLLHTQTCFDIIRIDHFRGFYNYWAVAAGAKTAMKGSWKKGPGMDFINKMKRALPPGSIIAEDLGDLDEKALAFIKETGLPGMRVLVYAFDPVNDSGFLPHNIPADSVAYTSSHDSPPFIGWLYSEASPEERLLAFRYLRLNDGEGYGWCAAKAVWGSPAKLSMAMLQDILGLGADSRINMPATTRDRNWCWRVRGEALNDDVAAKLLEITKTYKRQKPDYDPEKILNANDTQR